MKRLARTEPWQTYRAKDDTDSRELILVGGSSPYLWIGDLNGGCFGTFSGSAELRKFRDALTRTLRKRP